MFADLHGELDSLPPVSIVAVGGLPVRKVDGSYRLFGAPIDEARLRAGLREGLGLGAVLTYRNRSDKSLDELAQLCIERDHFWTGHVLTLTLAFDGVPIGVRNAFAFDGRFHLSWVEAEIAESPCTFTATGSVREWSRVIGYGNDASFRAEARAWFDKVGRLLAPLFPSASRRKQEP